MDQTQIERVDSVPLILTWMQQMHLAEHIDSHWQPHREWEGLSYGQLTTLFIAFVLQQRQHRLSYFEDWLTHHQYTIQTTTGWVIGAKDGTDDRLGMLLQTLGRDADRLAAFHEHHGQHLVHAYALPTDVARYDTTSFNVHHAPADSANDPHALLRFGYSKDHRPDLLQFKQALGTLDPAGVPLVSHTLPGHVADDPHYLPAWREFTRILGHMAFLFVSDAKGASLTTRATIASEGGSYLFPLPMTGDVPDVVRQTVTRPPTAIRPLTIPTSVTDSTPRDVGRGCVVWRTMHHTLDDGTVVSWRERWLVTHSPPHAARQTEQMHRRLAKAEQGLDKLRPRPNERATDVQKRVAAVVAQQQVQDLLTVTVTETATTHQRSGTRGRPRTTASVDEETRWTVQVDVKRNDTAIAHKEKVAGWRVYVTNTRQDTLTHAQAVAHYREQWIAEHGYHRFKKGSLPVLPLLLRIPERIVGLLVVLLLALQVLTLMELVAHQSLVEQDDSIAGLVPGNPTMTTTRPTAERMLAAFVGLHLFVEQVGNQIRTRLVETLSPIQRYIIELLHLSPSCYDLTGVFSLPSLARYNE